MAVEKTFQMVVFGRQNCVESMCLPEEYTCLVDLKRKEGNMETSVRDDIYKRWHEKNLGTFLELARRIKRGMFQIISIQIDEPEFGHRRVIIMIHDKE